MRLPIFCVSQRDVKEVKQGQIAHSSHLAFVMSLLILLTTWAIIYNTLTKKLSRHRNFPLNLVAGFHNRFLAARQEFAPMAAVPLLCIIQNTAHLGLHTEKTSPRAQQGCQGALRAPFPVHTMALDASCVPPGPAALPLAPCNNGSTPSLTHRSVRKMKQRKNVFFLF